VASYDWDFGDGATSTTSGPTTSHTYAAPGNYTATLTVTDDAGCSTERIFTGQTMSCNGSPVAKVSHQVTVVAHQVTVVAPPATNPNCDRLTGLRAKMKRQRRVLNRAGSARKVRLINGNIRNTKRRIRGIGC
jgi:PKD repeat protein